MLDFIISLRSNKIGMKTKAKKIKELELGVKLLNQSQTLVFADFSGVGVELIRKLKSELKKTDAKFSVIKKRIFRIALKNKGVDFDPTRFKSQLGIIFIPNELSSSAGSIYKFAKELAKEKKKLKILGVYEIPKGKFLNPDEFTAIAKLPTREVLLSQVLGAMSAPLRAFMYMLSEISKKGPAVSEAKEEKVAQ